MSDIQIEFTWCDTCQQYTEQEVIDYYKTDIPVGETYFKTRCNTCNDTSEYTNKDEW